MINIELRGMERIMRKLPHLVSKPLRMFFERAAIVVQGHIRTGAPVDTGHLRNMITTEVDRATMPLYAKIGPLNASASSPLYYKARAMEFGTGRMGDPEVTHKSSHWPPPQALDLWARRHGFESGAQVARIIGRRGGLRPRRFMRAGFKASLAQIKTLLGRLGDEIKSGWDRR